MTRPIIIPGRCRNGHPRIPANRTAHDKCKVCVSVRRKEARERNTQAHRAQRERDQTAINVQLRGNSSTNDDTVAEHRRVAKVFRLMDELEIARSRGEREAIQSAIRELS